MGNNTEAAVDVMETMCTFCAEQPNQQGNKDYTTKILPIYFYMVK